MLDANELLLSPTFLRHQSEMGDRIRRFAWETTNLGNPFDWPAELRFSVGMMLRNTHPMVICWGDDFIQLYNDAFIQVLGPQKHPASLGRPAREVYAESWTMIRSMFVRVTNGETVSYENFKVPLIRNGRLHDCFFNFSCSPILDDDEQVRGILAICIETTENVEAVKSLKSSNTELEEIKQTLVKANAALTESEENIRNIIMQAPMPMALLMGRDMVIEVVNDSFITLWGKDAGVRGKPILQALPEMEGQPYPGLLEQVYLTGEPYIGTESKVLLFRNRQLAPGYFTFINHPFHDGSGKIIGVIVLANEVTDQVLARQNVQRALDQARLSKEAAELGVFDIDLENNTMEWDRRCRELFGIDHEGAVDYQRDFIGGLHPQDRDRIIAIIDNCFNKVVSDGAYDVEYRTVGQRDGRQRWVRAKGQVYFDDRDKPMRFIGSIMDITEQKMDELRKNDFIAMVSHELKTPLTSLSAIVQLMKAKLGQQDDSFLKNAAANAVKQTRRMTTMIDGFLNIAQLETGKIQLKKEPFDLDNLLAEAVAEARLLNQNHQIHFRQRVPLEVIADKNKISSVISNLLSNAAKYSPDGSNVFLSCSRENNNARVVVRDEGVGIKAEDQARVFERYFRVDNNGAKLVSGFGIGLYLAAEIIKLHGGSTDVASEPGKGSAFSFLLPLAS